jgi:predicted transcriptional regulator
MNPLSGPFTADQRDTISATSDMLALLPVPGSRDLSARLGCIAQTRRPSNEEMTAAAALAHTVQRALAVEASPDRWLDDVSGYDAQQQSEIIADLIDQRCNQSTQVGQVIAILQTVTQNQHTRDNVLT